MRIFILMIFIHVTMDTNGQKLPTYKSKVSLVDKIDHEKDRDFGVGDDGINRISEPTVNTSSELYKGSMSLSAENISDYNLNTPWVSSNQKKAISEFIVFTYDFLNYSNKGKAISINSLFLINGYRNNINQWKNYSRVKKLKMFINDQPIAYFLLQDTYKFQSFDFPDYWFNYGDIWKIRLEIIEIYSGDKYRNIAISEIQFEGKYSENQ